MGKGIKKLLEDPAVYIKQANTPGDEAKESDGGSSGVDTGELTGDVDEQNTDPPGLINGLDGDKTDLFCYGNVLIHPSSNIRSDRDLAASTNRKCPHRAIGVTPLSRY